MVCSLLYHPIAPPAIIVTYPAVERPVSTQSPWEASVYVRKSSLFAKSKFVISSGFDVTKEVFECFPVLWTRIGIEACEISNRVCNIRTSHHGKVLKRINCTEIGDLKHEVLLLLCAWGHGTR